MAKRAKILLIILVLGFIMVSGAGCVPSAAYEKELSASEGVYLFLYNDEDGKFVAELDILVNDGSWGIAVTTLDLEAYVYNTIKAQYPELTRSEVEKAGNYSYFYYTLTFDKASDFLDVSHTDKTGFLNGRRYYTLKNPFAGLIEEGTPLNAIYNDMKNGDAGKGTFALAAFGYDIDTVPFTVMVAASSRNSTTNGSLIKYGDYLWLYWTGVNSGEGRFEETLYYEIGFYASYGWWIISILIAAAVTDIILLTAKKGAGKTVRTGRPGTGNPGRPDVFGFSGQNQNQNQNKDKDVFEGF